MLRLNLPFWASTELRDPAMYSTAIAHAKTSQSYHVRPDSSTYHVVNLDQTNGAIQPKVTNQGYSDSSCWSRGQAWTITALHKLIHGHRNSPSQRLLENMPNSLNICPQT